MIPQNIASLISNGQFKASDEEGNPTSTIMGYVSGETQVGIFKFSKPHFFVKDKDGITSPYPITNVIVHAKSLEDYPSEEIDLVEAIAAGYWPGEVEDFEKDFLTRIKVKN